MGPGPKRNVGRSRHCREVTEELETRLSLTVCKLQHRKAAAVRAPAGPWAQPGPPPQAASDPSPGQGPQHPARPGFQPHHLGERGLCAFLSNKHPRTQKQHFK